jgi:hypothetical protein
MSDQIRDEHEIVATFSHDQMMGFVLQEIKKPEPMSRLFWLMMLIQLGLSMVYYAHCGLGLWPVLGYFALGTVLFFVLIPLHEWIHVWGYKLAGAKKVSVHAQWRKGVFYAQADGFVCRYRPFMRMAVAPFVIITALLIGLFAISTVPVRAVLLSVALWHSSGCLGDFALMNWMWKHRKLEPITWDDAAERLSYFALKNSTHA